ERLAAGVGVSPARLDQLVALFRGICEEVSAGRGAVEPSATDPGAARSHENLIEMAAEIAESLKPAIYEALVDCEAEIASAEPALSPEAARARAAELWRRLEPLTPRWRRLAIEHGEEYRSWAVCERLCEESFRAAAREPEAAQALVDLALSVAELAAADDLSRQRLTGYALAFAAHVDRTHGDAEESAEKLRRAQELWTAGDGSDDLDGQRVAALLSGKAS